MSEFLSNDILPDLWEEILKRHWTFLEMEESVKKLEERKMLEGCLKEFLCVVPHDRKFFLPETGHVLRKTVNELDEFSVHKATIGFEAISQYANNLFTKPWRKEYRVIKMYCGYFQHEIKSNLLDAIKLFKAMGYRQVSNELLMLDGPICPDQVTNVSRDAMAAYVECQIIKNIYSGVTGMGFNCTWQDIFHYRENHTGGSSQAIKGFLYTLQDRHFKKDRQENIYATIQRMPKATTSVGQHAVTAQCQNCAACCSHIMHHAPPPLPPSHPQTHLYNGTCAVRSSNTNNNICALHPNNNTNNNNNYNNNNDFSVAQATPSWFGGHHSNKLLASYPLTNYHHQQQQPQQGTCTQHFLSHSRSLECYSEPPPPPLPPHRHSFDQQHACTALLHSVYCQQHPAQPVYESPYNCLDGLSLGDSSSAGPSYAVVGAPGATNCSYNAAYSHPYNVSGNRYPLPYTISNQLNSHYDTPATSCNGGPLNPLYVEDNLLYMDNDVKRNCNYHAITALQKQSSPLPPNRHYFSAASKDLQAYRQRSFPPDQHLIDFDDCALLTDHDFHAQLHTRSQNNSFDYEREHERCERMYDAKQRAVDRRTSRTAVAAPSDLIAGVNRLAVNSSYTQTKDTIEQNQSTVETSQSTTTSSGDGSYYGLSQSNNAASSVLPSGNLGAQQRCGQRYAREDTGALKTTNKYTKKSGKMNEITESNYMKNKELNDLQNNGSRVEMVETSSTDHEMSDGNYYPTTLDDFVSMATSELPVRKTQLSPTQAIKNQDGVGSFESWNRVFKSSGYAKENDCNDSLVESLHLDSFNAPTSSSGAASNGISDKRRSSHVALALESGCGGGSDGGKGDRPENNESSTTHKSDKTLFCADLSTGEKRLNSGKATAKSEKSILKQRDSNAASSNQQKIKSALKSTTKAASNTSNSINANNNNNNSSNAPNIQQKSQYKNGRIFTNTNTKRQTNVNVKQPRPVATQVVITSPDEWSCRICTFLNPNTKRICEMCSRSKDFNLDASISNTPTCV